GVIASAATARMWGRGRASITAANTSATASTIPTMGTSRRAASRSSRRSPRSSPPAVAARLVHREAAPPAEVDAAATGGGNETAKAVMAQPDQHAVLLPSLAAWSLVGVGVAVVLIATAVIVGKRAAILAKWAGEIWLTARVKELTKGAQTPRTTIPGERFINPRVFMVQQQAR